jgi:hypothetical protein
MKTLITETSSAQALTFSQREKGLLWDREVVYL